MEVEKVCPSVNELLEDRGKKDIICPHEGCGKTLPHAGALNMHMIKVHRILKNEHSLKLLHRSGSSSKVYNYHCPETSCKFNINLGRFFKTITALKQHYHKVHAEKKFKCPRCCYGYGLEADMLRHTSKCNVTFLCNDCHASFSSKHQLHTHCMESQHKYMFSDLPTIEQIKATKPATSQPEPMSVSLNRQDINSTSQSTTKKVARGINLTDAKSERVQGKVMITSNSERRAINSTQIIRLPGNKNAVILKTSDRTHSQKHKTLPVIKCISKMEFSRIIGKKQEAIVESKRSELRTNSIKAISANSDTPIKSAKTELERGKCSVTCETPPRFKDNDGPINNIDVAVSPHTNTLTSDLSNDNSKANEIPPNSINHDPIRNVNETTISNSIAQESSASFDSAVCTVSKSTDTIPIPSGKPHPKLFPTIIDCNASRHFKNIAPKSAPPSFIIIPPTFNGNIIMNSFNLYGSDVIKASPMYKAIQPKPIHNNTIETLNNTSPIHTEPVLLNKQDDTPADYEERNHPISIDSETTTDHRLSISTQTSVPCKTLKRKRKAAETQTAGDYILKKAMISAKLPIVKESRASQVSPRAKVKRLIRESNTSETQTQMSPKTSTKKRRRKSYIGCDSSVNTDSPKRGVSIGVGHSSSYGEASSAIHDVSVQEIQTEAESVLPLPSVEDMARIVESISTQTPQSFLATCTQVPGLENTRDSEMQTRLHMDMGIDACDTIDVQSLEQLGINVLPSVTVSTGCQFNTSFNNETNKESVHLAKSNSVAPDSLGAPMNSPIFNSISSRSPLAVSSRSQTERQPSSTISKAPPTYEEAANLTKQYRDPMFASPPPPIQVTDTLLGMSQTQSGSVNQTTNHKTVDTSVGPSQSAFDLPNFLSTEVQTIDFDYTTHQTQTDVDDDFLHALTNMQTQTNDDFWHDFGMSNMQTQTRDSSFETMDFDGGIHAETQTSRTKLQQNVEVQASISQVDNSGVGVISADTETQTPFQDELANSQTQTKWEDLMNIEDALS